MKTSKIGSASHRRSVLTIAAISLLGPWLSNDAAAQSQRPLKIGVVAGLSGPFASTGQDVVDGLRLASDLYGEVLGQKIQLIVEDSAGNPDQAVTKAIKLVERDEVVAIIGLTFSGETLAVQAISERLRVPLITTNAAANQITGQNRTPWIFRTIPNDSFSANALSKYRAANPALKNGTWYIVGHDIAYGRSIAEAAKKTGIRVVGESFWPMSTFDWAPSLSRIQKEKPDFILMGTAVGTPFLQFIKQANDFGVLKSVKIVAPIGVADNVVTELGTLAEGILVVGQWAAWTFEDRSPELKKFNEAFAARHKRVPPFQAISSAAGLQVLVAAINEAKSSNPEAIRKAMAGISASTLIGKIQIRAADHQALAPLFSGRYVRLQQPRYGANVALQIESVIPGIDVANPAQ